MQQRYKKLPKSHNTASPNSRSVGHDDTRAEAVRSTPQQIDSSKPNEAFGKPIINKHKPQPAVYGVWWPYMTPCHWNEARCTVAAPPSTAHYSANDTNGNINNKFSTSESIDKLWWPTCNRGQHETSDAHYAVITRNIISYHMLEYISRRSRKNWYENNFSDRNRLVKWAIVLCNFWPHLGVNRTKGSKVMGKIFGPEWASSTLGGTSGLTSPTFPSSMDRIWQAIPKLLNLQ